MSLSYSELKLKKCVIFFFFLSGGLWWLRSWVEWIFIEREREGETCDRLKVKGRGFVMECEPFDVRKRGMEGWDWEMSLHVWCGVGGWCGLVLRGCGPLVSELICCLSRIYTLASLTLQVSIFFFFFGQGEVAICLEICD